jgi:hypothetical protein
MRKSTCAQDVFPVCAGFHQETAMAMTHKDDLSQARNDMLSVLDEKLAQMPEWRAFRAMDKALWAMSAMQATAPKANGAEQPTARRRTRTVGTPSYADLAIEAIDTKGFPIPTADIVRFIGTRRELDPDQEKARVNIQSGLSRDKKIRSISWRGGRAWWHANRPPPKESAGTRANS